METLSCNNCGAVIELPDTTNYATCARCGAHLVVRRGETARYTEVLADSDAVQHAADTEAELDRMRIEMAIMALDQEWQGRRSQYMTFDRAGYKPGYHLFAGDSGTAGFSRISADHQQIHGEFHRCGRFLDSWSVCGCLCWVGLAEIHQVQGVLGS